MKAAAMGIDVSDGYPVEMHKVFRFWFTWGFWAKIYLIVIAIVFGNFSKYLGSAGDILGTISCGLYCVNGLIWMCVGAFWRYSNAGSVASGDTLERPENTSDEDW